jgi:hypothetical protein
MDHVGALLGGLALLGIVTDGLLRQVDKRARKFPWCKTCGTNMTAAGLPKFMPGELVNHLDKHGLPTVVASRFICPKGHYQLWFVPKFGNTEKAFFLREEL